MHVDTINQLESMGFTVIHGHEYAVIDYGDRAGGREIVGLSPDGDLLARQVTIIPKDHGVDRPYKLYVGNSVSQIKSRISTKTALESKGVIKDEKNIDDAIRDGDVFGM